MAASARQHTKYWPLVAVVFFATASCFDAAGPARSDLAVVAFEPVYELRTAQDLVPIHRVRVLLLRTGTTASAVDTTILYLPAPGADSMVVDLAVQITSLSGIESFDLNLAMMNAAGDTVFRGQAPVTISVPGAPDAPPPTPAQVPTRYVGTGSEAASVRFDTRDTTARFGDTLVVSARAFSAAGAVLPGTPVEYSTLDPTLISIPDLAQGRFVMLPVRGTARIVARTLTGQADTARVIVTPVPASITLLSGNSQSGAAGTELPLPLAARLLAADGLPVAGAFVKFAIPPAAGTLSELVATTDADGVARTRWTLGTTAGPVTATAVVSGPGGTLFPGALGASPITWSATIVAGPAATLHFTAQPSATIAGAAFAPAVGVTARDAFGNVASSFIAPVALALTESSARGATLGGTVSTSATGGVALFPTASIARANTAYRLRATSGTMAAESDTFSIVPGAAARLSFRSQPVTKIAGAEFAAPVVVTATDAFDNVVSGFTGIVRLGPTPGTGRLENDSILTEVPGDTLDAPRATAVGGIATFGTLGGFLVETIRGFSLTAHHGSLTAAVSDTFSVLPGPAHHLRFVGFTERTLAAGSPLDTAVRVRIEDQHDNRADSFADSVFVTLTGGATGAVLGGSTRVMPLAGLARFTGLSVSRAATGYRLRATGGALPALESAQFTIVPGAPAVLALVSAPPADAPSGDPFTNQPAVQVRDLFGNDVAVAGTIVGASIASGGGVLDGAASATTDGTGRATFSNLGLSGTPGPRTLMFSASLGSTEGNVVSGTITLGEGRASTVTSLPTVSTAVGAGTPVNISLVTRDAAGNTRTTSAGVVTVEVTGANARAPITATDPANGSYTATYTPTVAGTDLVTILIGGAAVAGSPHTVTINPGGVVSFTVELAGGGPIPAQTAGSAFSLDVTARDAFGNIASGFAGAVNFTGPLAAGGGVSPPLVGGRLLAHSVTINAASAANTVTATREGGTETGTSATFAVNPGAASAVTTTASVPAGTAGSSTVATVTPRDASGNVRTESSGVVAATISSGPNAGAGVIVLGQPDGTYTVSYTPTLAGTDQLAITLAGTPISGSPYSSLVSPGAAAKLAVVAAPSPTAVNGEEFVAQPVIRLQDAAGNPVPEAGRTITVAISIGAGTLSGTLSPVTDADGSVTFTDLRITGTTGERTLAFTSAGLTQVTSVVNVGPGAPSAAMSTAVVPATAVAGTETVITVQARDASGNARTTTSGTVTAGITGANTAAGVVEDHGNGTYTVRYTPTVTGSDFVAISLGGTPVADSPFTSTVSAGALSHFDVTNTDGLPVGTQTAGASFAVRVVARDAGGNTVTLFTGTVNLFSPDGAVLTSGGGTTPSFVAGVLSSHNLTVSNVGTFTLTGTRSGGTETGSSGFTVNGGAVTSFTVEKEGGGPIADQAAGAGFAIRVTARDALGNVANLFTGTVDMTATAPLITGGGTTASFVNGVLASHAVQINASGPLHNLTATLISDTENGTSNNFAVNAAATHPASTTADAPSDGPTGAPINISVQARDAFGNPRTTSSGDLSASIISGPNTGASFAIFDNGDGTYTASYTPLAAPGTDQVAITLDPDGGGPAPAAAISGSPFSILALTGPAAALVMHLEPSASAASGVDFAIQPVVRAKDASGNNVAVSGLNVTAAILSSPGGAPVLGGSTLIATLADGTASFGDLRITGLAGNYALQFTAELLTPATSATIEISGGTATEVVITTQPPTTVTELVEFGAVVRLKDAGGNLVGSPPTLITASLATGTGSLGGTLAHMTDGTGAASFTDLTIAGSGSHTIQFTSSFPTVTSDPIDITEAPAAASIEVIGSDTLFLETETTSPPIGVLVRDQFGNPMPGVEVSWENSETFEGTLVVTTGITDASGRSFATFSPDFQESGAIIAGVVDESLIFTAYKVVAFNSDATHIWRGGAGDPLWETPGNWLARGAAPPTPDASAIVFIPLQSFTSPSLTTNTSMQTLDLEEGQLLVGGPHNVTLSGHATIRGTFSTTGVLSLQGEDGPHLLTIFSGPITNITGNYLAWGNANVAALTITGGNLDVGNASVQVSGNFTTQAGGTLQMADPAGYMVVQGNATFNGGSTTGLLTAGGLQVDGNFTQGVTPGAYDAEAAHKLYFSGATLTLAHAASSRIGSFTFVGAEPMTLAAPGGSGTLAMHVVGDVEFVETAGSLSTIGNVNIGGSYIGRTSVWTAALTTFNSSGSTANVSGSLASNVSIKGDIDMQNAFVTGNVFVDGLAGPAVLGVIDTVHVTGTLYTINGARFKMACGCGIFVGGEAAFAGGSTEGLLTAGRLHLGGDFAQDGDSKAFSASATHTTIFEAGRNIRFANAGTTDSHFGNLTLRHDEANALLGSDVVVLGSLDAQAGGIAAAGSWSVFVAGDVGFVGVASVSLEALAIGGVFVPPPFGVYSVNNTIFTGIAQTIPQLGGAENYASVGVTGTATTSAPLGISGTLKVGSAVPGLGVLTLGANINVTGDLVVGVSEGPNARLVMNGRRITMNGNFSTAESGVLEMTTGNDSLIVNGDVTFGGSSPPLALTAGHVIFTGSFAQTGTDLSYAPSGTHTLVRDASSNGTVSLALPGFSGGGNYLNRFRIEGDGCGGACTTTFTTDANIRDSLVVEGNSDAILSNGETAGEQRLFVEGVMRTADGALVDVDRLMLAQAPAVGVNFTADTLAWNNSLTVALPALAQHATTPVVLEGFTSDISVDQSFLSLRVAEGASLQIGPHKLTVLGDFVQNGMLVMRSGTDSLEVFGNALFDNATESGSTMDGGTVILHGNFAQTATLGNSGYYASGVHTTILRGSGSQTISFASPDLGFGGGSRFQNLTTNRGSGPAVIIADSIDVNGTLVMEGEAGGNAFTGPGYLAARGGLTVFDANAISVKSLFFFAATGGLGNIAADTVIFGGTGALPDIPYNSLRIVGSSVNLALPTVTVLGKLELQDAILDLNGDSLYVDGDFLARDNSQLISTSGSSVMSVGGNAEFDGGATDGVMTAGRLWLYGDLVQSATTSMTSFAPGPEHHSVFAGSAARLISFASGDTIASKSHFGRLTLSGGGTVTMIGFVSALGRIRVEGTLAATPTITGPGSFVAVDSLIFAHTASEAGINPVVTVHRVESHRGIGLSPEPGGVSLSLFAPDTTVFASNNQTFEPGGHKNIRIAVNTQLTLPATGGVITNGGEVLIDGDLNLPEGSPVTYTINGNLTTRGDGVLRMPETAHIVAVTGDALFGGGTSDLVDGELHVGGNFTQTGSSMSFRPANVHTTVLNGFGAAQTVTFANPGFRAEDSRFQHLRIENSSPGLQINLATNTYVAGQLRTSASPTDERTIQKSGGGLRSLVVHGLDADRLHFVDVAVQVDTMSAGFTRFNRIRWSGMTDAPGFDYLSVFHNGGGTFAMDKLHFEDTPEFSFYVRAFAPDVPSMTVQVTNALPFPHGERITFNANALVEWFQFGAP